MQKRFLIFVSIMTAISLLAWSMVLFRLDPCAFPGESGCEKASPLALIFFSLSLFFLLVGLFTLAGYFLRRQMQGEFFYDQMGISLRQGVLLAFTSLASLFLFLYGVLTWWSGLLLLALAVLVELYFTAKA